MKEALILGTRSSALAMAQAGLASAALQRAHASLRVSLREFTTRGDRKLDLSLIRGDAGGKGLFTKELEEALLSAQIDVAVHSLKDLPAVEPADLRISAVLERQVSGDALVSKHEGGLDGLPTGATIGTSSVRRASQLRWLRPDLKITEWRGNVGTRLRKLGESGECAAIVLAEAGLARLGYALGSGALTHESHSFHLASLADVMFPAIGQGIIALQCRSADPAAAALLSGANHPATFQVMLAERAFQKALGGDCTLPVGLRTLLRPPHMVLRALFFCSGADQPVSAEAVGEMNNPEQLGTKLFLQLQHALESHRLTPFS